MRIRSLGILAILIATPLSAQWTKTSPNLLGSVTQGYGAMTFKAGIAWAGATAVWKSTDSGLHWVSANLSVPGDKIAQIYFFDNTNGIVTTRDGHIFRTINGAQSWKEILTVGTANSGVFFHDTAHIVVSEFDPGSVHYSSDGGLTWKTSSSDAWNREILPADKSGNGWGYLLTGNWYTDMSVHIWVTTNYGASWTQKPGQAGCDSWSFDFEQCNSKNMYIVKEEYSHTISWNGRSRIYVSSDEGQSWQITADHPSKFFAGSLTLSPHAVYVPTVAEANAGVYRSTDHGQTWQDIAGPSSAADTRLIAAIDDNHLIASDFDGSIWITQNSGGDSLRFPSGSGTLAFSGNSEAIVQRNCVPTDTVIPYWVLGCAATVVSVDSIWISGSSAYQLLGNLGLPKQVSRMDSVVVQYKSTVNNHDTATLHIRYHNGSLVGDTTITLLGSGSGNTPATLSLPVTTAMFSRTSCIGSVDTTIPLAIAGCLPHSARIDSLWIDGSSTFGISDGRKIPRPLGLSDSVRLRYAPGSHLADTGLLHVRYDLDGAVHDTTVTLLGTSSSPFIGSHAYQHLAIRSGSFNQLVTMPLMEDISDSTLLKASWGNLNTITATISFDPSKLTYQSYNPPAGWTTASTVSSANSVQFSITNVSSTPTRPLDMGEAVFKVTDTHAGMTLVQLNDLRLRIGQSDDGVCLSTSEDEMWGIEILPLARSWVISGVSESSLSHSIRIRPNPFEDCILIDDPEGTLSSVEIVDVLGRWLQSEIVRTSSAAQIETFSLPPGTYFVICHTSDQMLSFRMTKAR